MRTAIINTGTPASFLSFKNECVSFGIQKVLFFFLLCVYDVVLLSRKNILLVVRGIAVAPGFQGRAHPLVAGVVFLGGC